MPEPLATITAARIDMDTHPWKMMGTVNGKEEELFQYYGDELTFTPEEMIGLTPQQARDLHHKKDVAYLQS